MSVGYQTIQRINKVQQRAKELGFTLSDGRHSYIVNEYSGRHCEDTITLRAIEETLPAFRDGSDHYTGNLDEVDAFLLGIIWARRYDTALGLKTSERREKSEQKIRNRKLVQEIKHSGR